ncbi:MAG: lysozyme inhibitor LprI family protein [Betaproteobacteria bacterium]
MSKRVRTTSLICCVLLANPLAVRAVTDCSKPKSKIDWMICSNERVASREERMAVAFRGAMRRAPDREVLLKEQREWTTNVRDACNDVACLTGAYQARTDELDTY